MAGFEALSAWLRKQGIAALSEVHFVMEATGVYHERCATWCADAGARVSVVNPAESSRTLPELSRSEPRPTAWIARLWHGSGYLVKPELWQPPPVEVRELKALLARLETLAKPICAVSSTVGKRRWPPRLRP